MDNLPPNKHLVTRAQRSERNGHPGGVLWFTGLSAAGKTTLSLALEERLFRRGYTVYVLDGDNVRHGLNADLGFEAEDRRENLRRLSQVAALFADAGMIVITAFIAPYALDRQAARIVCGEFFHEVYIKASVADCVERDPRGLYAKAIKGEIKNFTGISDVYEEPRAADLVVETARYDVAACLDMLLEYVERHFPLAR